MQATVSLPASLLVDNESSLQFSLFIFEVVLPTVIPAWSYQYILLGWNKIPFYLF